MSKYRLAIADTESEYVFALTDYILNHLKEHIEVAAFTKPENLGIYLENTAPALLIAGAEFTEECRKAGDKTKLFFFDCDDGLSPPQGEKLEKYQAADELLKKAFAEFSADIFTENSTSGKKERIQWVYSPSKNQLLQPFAYTLAANCAREETVLLLNTCENAAFEWMFQKEQKEDLANVFYLLSQGKGLTEILKQNSVSIEGMEVIAPMKNAWDLCELPTELWSRFWSELAKQEVYEDVIIVSDSIRPGMEKLAEETGCLWILGGEDDYEQAQCREFAEETEAGMPSDTKRNVVVLPRIRTICHGEQAIRQWLYGELGDEVRKYV